MKFGDDWHGVFIRGDEAFYYAHQIRRIEAAAVPDMAQQPIAFKALRGLCLLLESCNEHPAGVPRAVEGAQLMLPFEQCVVGGNHG